jgi:hypothetical protein
VILAFYTASESVNLDLSLIVLFGGHDEIMPQVIIKVHIAL